MPGGKVRSSEVETSEHLTKLAEIILNYSHMQNRPKTCKIVEHVENISLYYEYQCFNVTPMEGYQREHQKSVKGMDRILII